MRAPRQPDAEPFKRDPGWQTTVFGYDFSAIESFVWEKTVVIQDTRKNYGETRFLAYGPIEDRLYCVAFTVREKNIRIISLRKANSREVKRYG